MMEPGEYPTNIVSINNLAHIPYEYFVPQSSISISEKNQLQRLENKWRQEGHLVYYDALQDRIWAFRSRPNTTLLDSTTLPESLVYTDIKPLGFLCGGAGVFDPANLKSNRNISNLSNAPSSCSLGLGKENYVKKSQILNDRAIKLKDTENDPFESSKKEYGVSVNELYEYFISAVLGSVRTFLCRDNKYIQFNSRTLIPIRPQTALYYGYPDTVEFATLDVNLTSMGTLLIKIYFDIVYGFQKFRLNEKK